MVILILNIIVVSIECIGDDGLDVQIVFRFITNILTVTYPAPFERHVVHPKVTFIIIIAKRDAVVTLSHLTRVWVMIKVDGVTEVTIVTLDGKELTIKVRYRDYR